MAHVVLSARYRQQKTELPLNPEEGRESDHTAILLLTHRPRAVMLIVQ